MNSFVVVRLDGAALVWTDWTLNGAVAPELYRVLQELLDAGTRPVVVDLVEVPSIDNSAVAVLAAAAVRAGQLGFGLELRLPGGHAMAVRDAAQLRSALMLAYPTAA
ncbi:MAG TPA: STAS domain-containing protein [Planosporangium sp.]|jgi:anti-anti-sigma regulatory factor|nr:STAS domain-containing protein [Planosporangium sp.]